MTATTAVDLTTTRVLIHLVRHIYALLWRVGIIAAAAVGGVMLSGCALQNQQWHADCTVTAKDILYEKSDDGALDRKKRVSTTCGTFLAKDTLVGNFNSRDWAALEVGKTYDIKTGGYRADVLSMFPTILEVRAK